MAETTNGLQFSWPGYEYTLPSTFVYYAIMQLPHCGTTIINVPLQYGHYHHLYATQASSSFICDAALIVITISSK